jgi:hypothetical protein
MKKYIAIAGFFLLFFCYFACSKPHYTNSTTEYDFSILVFYDGVAIALSDVDDAYHLQGNTCALDKTKLKIVRNYDDVVLNNDDLMFFSAGNFIWISILTLSRINPVALNRISPTYLNLRAR